MHVFIMNLVNLRIFSHEKKKEGKFSYVTIAHGGIISD